MLSVILLPVLQVSIASSNTVTIKWLHVWIALFACPFKPSECRLILVNNEKSWFLSDERVKEDSLLEFLLVNFLKLLEFVFLLLLDDVNQGIVALFVQVISLDLINPLQDLVRVSWHRQVLDTFKKLDEAGILHVVLGCWVSSQCVQHEVVSIQGDFIRNDHSIFSDFLCSIKVKEEVTL